MKVIRPRLRLIDPPTYVEALDKVTKAASTCYKSRPKDKEAFVRKLVTSGHTSTIEHVSLSFELITDRAVTHEIVRHRLASYSQESQRYCAQKDEVVFCKPHWVNKADPASLNWIEAMETAEKQYHELLQYLKPEDARAVLPNSTATTIVCTFNFRSLENFFKLRTSKAAHPDIRRIARTLLRVVKKHYPAFFNHIGE